MARAAAERVGRPLTADNVRTLVEAQLRPLGLVLRSDGSAPELKRSNPLLGLRAKVSVTDPHTTRRLTDPFRALFHPWVWAPLLMVFLVVCWWLLFDKGLASATYQAFQSPGLLLLVVAVTVFSAGFHEFGHAAAARRGGAQPGVMGAGIYLVWPAFYTDVTDSYRLGRVGRVRTDLGGLYFNAIVAVAITAGWWWTGWDALLLVVATQILQMIRQLAPLVRFDGYHVLADVTGVPDLYPRIGPTLASLWPTRWHDPKASELKPWARAVITVWVLAVVPLLAFTLLTLLYTLPRIIATAWVSVAREWNAFTAAISEMALVDAAAALVGIIAFGFPVLAIALMLWRLASTTARSVWRRTEGRPARRVLAGAVALGLLAGLAWAWWPDPARYRPVLPFEGGTIDQAVAAPLARAGVTLPATTTTVEGGYARTLLPADGPMPTEQHPQPALVLIPHTDTGTGTSDETGDEPDGSTDDGNETDGDTDAPPTWVFPFDQPLPPGAGDNQALAVNTADGTVTYDVAVAMVWVTDDTVLNTNEAMAAASCSDCAAVAVAFQVVLIVGDADVVVPQNLSTAVNYDCFRCITAAIASQLVVTVDALPGEEQVVALTALWNQILAFTETIPDLSLDEVLGQLEDYQQQILEILDVAVQESATDPEALPTAAATATATDAATSSPTADPTDAGASSSPTPVDGASDGGVASSPQSGSSETPSGTPSESSPPSSSASPAATGSPDAGASDAVTP